MLFRSATFNKDAYSEIEGKGVGEKIFRMGYCEVYGEERAYHIVLFTAGAAALWLLYRMGTWMIEKCCRKRLDKRCFDGHLPVVIASVLFMAVYASRAIGMPQLIADSRLCAVEQMLILELFAGRSIHQASRPKRTSMSGLPQVTGFLNHGLKLQ